jgi:hypothetical protein
MGGVARAALIKIRKEDENVLVDAGIFQELLILIIMEAN